MNGLLEKEIKNKLKDTYNHNKNYFGLTRESVQIYLDYSAEISKNEFVSLLYNFKNGDEKNIINFVIGLFEKEGEVERFAKFNGLESNIFVSG